jgi:hypothetical protein
MFAPLMLSRAVPNPLVPKRLVSSVSRGPAMKLDSLASMSPELTKALNMFNENNIRGALDIALRQYKTEFEKIDPDQSMLSSFSGKQSLRPAFTFLSSLLSSLGPRHPETVATLAEMSSIGETSSPFKIRTIRKRHGGYPVRLNNGKWTWQGPHWSRYNNRTWKSGFSSDFTFGWGK